MQPLSPVPHRAPKRQIQRAAEQLAKLLEFKPGGSVSDVVEALGGKIIYRDMFGAKSPESIHIRNYNDFDIFVPNETPHYRDRFTVAHELGHLFLHYLPVKQEHGGDSVEMAAQRYLSEDASDDQKRCEWEANWFAAAFLMPSEEFQNAWKKFNGSVESLSKYFKVSISAITNRRSSLEKEGIEL